MNLKRTSKFLASFFGLLFVFTIALASEPTNEALHQALEKIRLERGATAAVLTIWQEDHPTLTLTEGYVSKRARRPVEASSLFQVGSITKSFMAVLFLELQADGQLRLDDSMTQYLPEYPKWNHVTLRELLNHTSGIYNYTTSLDFMKQVHQHPNRQYTDAQIVAMAYEKPLQFPSGKGWGYSNTNYLLAGMILQKVTNRSVAELLDNNIINPLSLNDTYYFPTRMPRSIAQQMVMGYTADDQALRNPNLSWMGSAGALISNSVNLVTWIKAIFYQEIITPVELKEMTNLVSTKTGLPLTNLKESGYGLGLKYRYDSTLGPIWFHPGGTAGFTAIVLWLPQKKLAIAMTINRDVNRVLIANHLADPILALF